MKLWFIMLVLDVACWNAKHTEPRCIDSEFVANVPGCVRRPANYDIEFSIWNGMRFPADSCQQTYSRPLELWKDGIEPQVEHDNIKISTGGPWSYDGSISVDTVAHCNNGMCW